MKSEKKANIILYIIAIVLILILVLCLVCLNKVSEFKILVQAGKLANENNYTYKVYEKDGVTPIYTMQYLNKKFKITEKDEPGFVEGDLNKNETIHVIPKDKLYAAIEKKESVLKYFPEFIETKHTFFEIFNKNIEKKTQNGEEVIIYTFKDKEKIKTYTIETKGNTLREYKETDLEKKQVFSNYRYEITLKNVEEYDVEPINRNDYEVKTTEDFEEKKNKIKEEQSNEDEKITEEKEEVKDNKDSKENNNKEENSKETKEKDVKDEDKENNDFKIN